MREKILIGILILNYFYTTKIQSREHCLDAHKDGNMLPVLVWPKCILVSVIIISHYTAPQYFSIQKAYTSYTSYTYLLPGESNV